MKRTATGAILGFGRDLAVSDGEIVESDPSAPPRSQAIFGAVLKRYRLAAHLTHAALAERAGVSLRAISDLERGVNRAPRRDTFALLADALELGPAQRAELEGMAGQRGTSTARPAPRSNLPAQRTSFIGRTRELNVVAGLLRRAQLVTLTGAGGCGKTRLALRVAEDLLGQFPDGVWFVDLSSVKQATHVPTTVLSALSDSEAADPSPLDALLRRVRDRRLLLVIDNCEHLLEACAVLVDALLSASSHLRVLATSREALRISGELPWRVPSLDFPDLAGPVDPTRMLDYGAVGLLVDRVQQVSPGFAVSALNAQALAQVCSRLDGIPLAIELAAARGGAMSVQEIADRLGTLHLLTGGTRTSSARHQTLRAAIDWSYRLLPETERVLFRRLAVFAGGWTLEAAEGVCHDDLLPRSDVLNALVRLVEQSLVNAHTDDRRTRYRFLETVRAYAAEQLQGACETAALQARHREWCLAVVERAADGLRGPDQRYWFSLLTAEHDNVRAALELCALDPDGFDAELRLAGAMGQYWWPRKPDEGRRWLVEALDRAPATPSAARASALTWQAMFELYYGDPVLARNLAHEGLADARVVGDARRVVDALWVLVLGTGDDDMADRIELLDEAVTVARAAGSGLVVFPLGFLAAAVAEAGDLERARLLLVECDGLARAAGDVWSQMTLSAQLGWLALAEGRLDEAESHFQSLIDLGADWGGMHGVPGLLGLGQVSLRRGDVEQARAVYRQLLVDLQQRSPGSIVLADALTYMASANWAAGLDAPAQRLLGANEAWHAAHGGQGRTWSPNARSPLKRGLVPIPPMPSDPSLLRARAEGTAMTLDEAVAHGLET
jgi:non-specific serine/threonine protein kinase